MDKHADTHTSPLASGKIVASAGVTERQQVSSIPISTDSDLYQRVNSTQGLICKMKSAMITPSCQEKGIIFTVHRVEIYSLGF